jgi:uncharacterized membrane protein YoaK (UPF0700 family)
MLLVVLAFTSGFIDAISFLGLAVFASVMTGNTVLLGLSINDEKGVSDDFDCEKNQSILVL